MSVKTISVEQIASPVLLTDSDLASMRIMSGVYRGSANDPAAAATSTTSTSARLPKNKSYSFLISRNSHFNRRQQLANSSTDSMITDSRASFNNNNNNNSNYAFTSSDTFSSSSSRRNFIKSRLS